MISRTTILLGAALWATTATAQELDPRTYSRAPVGTTILVSGFGHSEGAIVLDPSLGIQGAEADIWFTISGVGRIFPLAGRQARLLATFPMAWGDVSGNVGGEIQDQRLKGFVDPRFKLSVGLAGMPAMSRERLAGAARRPLLGTSVTVFVPVGRYEREQLVNLGYHRWAFKPEIGASVPAGHFTLEGDAGGWFYTTNRAYFPGTTHRRQDPVLSLAGHVAYSLPRRAWLAVDGTWFRGGQTEVDGDPRPDRQNNVRLGGTVSVPVKSTHSIKLTYSTGSTTRRGTDYDTFTLTWQFVKLGG